MKPNKQEIEYIKQWSKQTIKYFDQNGWKYGNDETVTESMLIDNINEQLQHLELASNSGRILILKTKNLNNSRFELYLDVEEEEVKE